jgi:outer membrane lipoprotein-sorting protein
VRRRLWPATIAVAVLAAAPVARADSKANAVLADAKAATRAVSTLTADLTLSHKPPGKSAMRSATGSVKLKRPNLANIRLSGAFPTTLVSNGTRIWTPRPGSTEYVQTTADPEGTNIEVLWALPINFFFNPSVDVFELPAGASFRRLPDRKVGALNYRILEAGTGSATSPRVTLYVGPDRLLHRVVTEVKGGAVSDATLRNVRTGVKLADADFQPPVGAVRTVTGPRRTGPAIPRGPAGPPAPRFSAPTPTGGTVSLEETLKGKKAVLINFWFST